MLNFLSVIVGSFICMFYMFAIDGDAMAVVSVNVSCLFILCSGEHRELCKMTSTG